MSNGLMSRVKVTAVVVTLTFAAAAVAFRDEWGRLDPSSDVNDTVTVHANWYRARVSQPIKFTVTVEGAPLDAGPLSHSPYDRTFPVPKGALVTATFDQPTGGRLWCRVDRDNRLGEPKERETAGVLACVG